MIEKEQDELNLLFVNSNTEDLSNQVCSICGSHHQTNQCNYLVIRNHVLNKRILTKARLSLPEDLIVDMLADGTNQVKTKTFIEKGTRFGPLEAMKSLTLDPSIQFPLKMFPCEEEQFLEYYLDTSNEKECTWLMFVQPASTYEEQNLICYQDELNIYYVTIKDVNENECLKVWYAPYYASRMKKSLLTMNKSEICTQTVSDVNRLVKLHQNILDRSSWTCKFCGTVKVDVTEFANHLIEHYMVQLRKTCEICKATFISRKSLRKHMAVVHNPALTNKMRKCVITESLEVSSQNTSIGGPLLNNLEHIDNFDSSNLLVPSLDRLVEDIGDMGTENLNFDNLLTENVKALDHFNFEIGDCQEEFVCEICVRSFSKLRYLIQHLKRHTGEHYCFTCGKIFTRKENLVNHSCSQSAKYDCKQCGRAFTQQKYLKRHIDGVHNEKFKCNSCNRKYCNKYELSRHNCKAQLGNNRQYSCTVCKQSFSHKQWLKKHILRQHFSENVKMFICTICGKQYLDKCSLDQHIKVHAEPTYQCNICHKTFFRKDVYKDHLELHDNQEIKCNICNKKLSSRKSLSIHRKTHLQEPRLQCNSCDAAFKTKSNLSKHMKMHQKPVKSTDLTSFFSCPYCRKSMKLKSSLARHISRTHPEYKNEPLVVKSNTQKEVAITCLGETKTNISPNNSDLDLKHNIDLINDTDMSELDSNLQIQIIDNILLNTTKEMGIEFNDELVDLQNLEINSCIREKEPFNTNFESREVCLSMPDLMENDLDVSLGDSAFILGNGTMEEPQEHSDNIIVYLLNEEPKER